MFFDARKYDFSRVGRLKFNIKLFENADATKLDNRTLEPDDFYGTIRYLLKLSKKMTCRTLAESLLKQISRRLRTLPSATCLQGRDARTRLQAHSSIPFTAQHLFLVTAGGNLVGL